VADIIPLALLGGVVASVLTIVFNDYFPNKKIVGLFGTTVFITLVSTLYPLTHFLLKNEVEIPYPKLGAVHGLETTEPPLTECVKENKSRKTIYLEIPSPCETVTGNKVVTFKWVDSNNPTSNNSDLIFNLNISECLYKAPSTTTKYNEIAVTLITDKPRRCNWWVTSFRPNGEPGPSSYQNQFFIH
jgi:hypothetical protein